MLLSLNLIVRNEEHFLPSCLESVKSWVDEIIVVDTGSTDRTIPIAESYGAKVFRIDWEKDFSKARNAAVVRTRADWILVLDADEQMTGDLQAFKKTLKTTELEAFWLDVENVTGSLPHERVYHRSLRLFRNRPQYRYQGPIHEDILPSIEKRNGSITCIGTSGLSLLHFGYLPEVREQKEKAKRNLTILQEAVKDQPKSSYYRYHLGVCYEQMGMDRDAVKLLEQALKSAPSEVSYRPTIVKDLSKLLIKTAAFPQAVKLLEKEKHKYEDYPDLHYYLGVAYTAVHQEDMALRSFQAAVGASPSRSYLTESGTHSFRSYLGMGNIAAKWSAYRDALKFYLDALNHCFYSKEAFVGIADVLIALNKCEEEIVKELLHIVSPNFQPDSPTYPLRELCEISIGEALFDVGCYRASREVLNSYLSRSPRIREWIALSLIREGEIQEVHRLAEPITASEAPDAPLLFHTLLLHSLEKAVPIPAYLSDWMTRQPEAAFYARLFEQLRTHAEISEEDLDYSYLLFVKPLLHLAIQMQYPVVIDRLTGLTPAFRPFTAKMLFYEGFVDQAADRLLTVMETEPLDGESFYILGLVLYDRGRWQEASVLFEQALSLDPEDRKARTAAALCYLQQAKSIVQEALERMPEAALLQANLQKLNLSIELVSKSDWRPYWRGVQRRNYHEAWQHFAVHDR
ncbi:TPR domain-containing glycosyltransferase [Paenibacillus tyrfis]|uniref:Glycosyltransferase 2-like domain-containing protein n=1 Tax=Paenibacillus tyrfis TaxID=1501230 RepID=A0A081P9K9_9BACL|nr:TPR domain-containing glycosyltransferase [Paenibacillus tyrfis]KEQ27382.1 hypothetical protein ET33_19195 [Paenibacillus tyrfis]